MRRLALALLLAATGSAHAQRSGWEGHEPAGWLSTLAMVGGVAWVAYTLGKMNEGDKAHRRRILDECDAKGEPYPNWATPKVLRDLGR